MTDCLFCRIIAGQSPSHTVYQDELVTAFYDIHPQAPIHLLLVPNRHMSSLADMDETDGPLLGRLISVANQMAAATGIAGTGYRLITNVGPDSGQIVFHLHFHLLGGCFLGPLLRPPL